MRSRLFFFLGRLESQERIDKKQQILRNDENPFSTLKLFFFRSLFLSFSKSFSFRIDRVRGAANWSIWLLFENQSRPPPRHHHPFTSQKVRKICLLLGESLLKPSSGDPHRYIFKHEVMYLVRPVTDIPDNYPFQRGAAIAQWIHLHLPSCCPGFESPAYHLHFCNL